MANTTTIQIKQDTKQYLDSLKIINREPYDCVIKRMVEERLEDELELNEETTRLLKKRMEDVRQGKVVSSEELREKLFGR